MSDAPKQTHALLEPRAYPQLVSLVFPLYNEEAVLGMLREHVTRLMDGLPCETEAILVNDGSNDGTAPALTEWASADRRVRVLHLSRNFGHQAAATAGLERARGDAVVLMDADLQDPPEAVPGMIAKYVEGWDVVYGVRTKREGESLFKRVTAWLFYRLMRALVYEELPVDAGDFRLMSRPCLDALKSMHEVHRFLRGMVAWVGFAQTPYPYERQARAGGNTKYQVTKMLRFAWGAAVSFSPLPLRLSFVLGLLSALAGFCYGVFAVAAALRGGHTVPGWASLVVLVCFLGGAILVGIGVLGEYVARVFEQVKGRPLYVVAREISSGEDEDDSAAAAAEQDEK